MPARFEFPFDAENPSQIWMPVLASRFSAQWADQRGASFLKAIGRLTPRRRPAGRAVRAVGDRRPDRCGQPAQRHARHRRAPVPGRAGQELPAGAHCPARRGRGGAADRMREHREPAARARHRAAARTVDSHRARREPRAVSSASSCSRASCSPSRAAQAERSSHLGRRRAGAHQPGADSSTQHGTDRSRRAGLHAGGLDADRRVVRPSSGACSCRGRIQATRSRTATEAGAVDVARERDMRSWSPKWRCH